jgi:hypothetical protein
MKAGQSVMKWKKITLPVQKVKTADENSELIFQAQQITTPL